VRTNCSLCVSGSAALLKAVAGLRLCRCRGAKTSRRIASSTARVRQRRHRPALLHSGRSRCRTGTRGGSALGAAGLPEWHVLGNTWTDCPRGQLVQAETRRSRGSCGLVLWTERPRQVLRRTPGSWLAGFTGLPGLSKPPGRGLAMIHISIIGNSRFFAPSRCSTTSYASETKTTPLVPPVVW
jgi:hypothetical protein